MHCTLKALSLVLGLILGLFVTSGAARASDYALGPGDKIELRVVVWQELERRFELWPALSGEYSVQTDGAVLIPLVGSVKASGKTTQQLSEVVASTLQARAGMIQPPAITVEIANYRPFYIIGDIARPGAYPASPGLTAVQAYALAGGGSARIASGNNVQAALRDTGALRQVMIDIARHRVTAARLRAEIDKKDAVSFPDDITHPDGTAALDAIKTEELRIFDTRRTALTLESENIAELKVLLETEVEALNTKMVGQVEQTGLARTNFENVKSLVDKGISRASLLVDAQRRLFELEGKELDLQNGIYRAQQRMKEADRDIVALQTRRATQSTAELQKVSADLEELVTRREILRQVVAENGAVGIAEDIAEPVTSYMLIKSGDEEGEETEVSAMTEIRAGDILRVIQTLDMQLQNPG